MNILTSILIVDTNVLIHLQIAGVVEEFVKLGNVKMINVVYHDEYECKNGDKLEKYPFLEYIDKISLDEDQTKEAEDLNNQFRKLSYYDICSYIGARDKNYILITGDMDLKKFAFEDVAIRGVIWVIDELQQRGKINIDQAIDAYMKLLNNPNVYLPKSELTKQIDRLEEMKQLIEMK